MKRSQIPPDVLSKIDGQALHTHVVADKPKRKQAMLPTARSLKWLRDNGYVACVVERWNQFAKVRQDLFGFIDIIAMNGSEMLAVQATSNHSNHAARRIKIAQSPNFPLWVASGGKVEIHSWHRPTKTLPWRIKVERLGP